MNSPQLCLRPTAPGDLDYVLALEARPDYGAFIYRWPRAEHLAALDDPDYRHLLLCDAEGVALGFALLAGVTTSAGSVELKRIALDRPGAGIGRAVLPLLIDFALEDLGARRFWLDVFADNQRARRAYRRAGFIEESGGPNTMLRDGQEVPVIVMAVRRDAQSAAQQVPAR